MRDRRARVVQRQHDGRRGRREQRGSCYVQFNERYREAAEVLGEPDGSLTGKDRNQDLTGPAGDRRRSDRGEADSERDGQPDEQHHQIGVQLADRP